MAYPTTVSYRARWLRLALAMTGAAALALVAPGSAAAGHERPSWLHVDRETARALGLRIWRNEGRGRADHLLWWNEGEAFASLGIGHFIWYPAGASGPFRESFPALLAFLVRHGVRLPGWLEEARHRGCPWATRRAFLSARASAPLTQLQALLERTVELQAQFIAAGLEPAYADIVAHAPQPEREAVAERFRALASSAAGLYALIDYLHFKGAGTHAGERYAGAGWGLLQVLQEMGAPGLRDIAPATAAFAASARTVLERRVANAPPQRAEARWLAGWRQRLLTYHPAGLKER